MRCGYLLWPLPNAIVAAMVELVRKLPIRMSEA
jgi:hypothetical protein